MIGLAKTYRRRLFFFFNDTATTEIYTLSLHDALPISASRMNCRWTQTPRLPRRRGVCRSEEHTSELQSHLNLVCRLLLEKKKQRSQRGVHPGNISTLHTSRCYGAPEASISTRSTLL